MTVLNVLACLGLLKLGCKDSRKWSDYDLAIGIILVCFWLPLTIFVNF